MYLIIKSLHLISVITWMAGLLYLPRIFVYHSLSEINSIQSETFKIMERRLLKAIMLPSIIFVFGSGLLMIYLNYYLIFELYFQAKAILVLIMGYIHGKISQGLGGQKPVSIHCGFDVFVYEPRRREGHRRQNSRFWVKASRFYRTRPIIQRNP